MGKSFRFVVMPLSLINQLKGGSGGCYANVGYWKERGVHTLNLARNYPGVGCFRHATIVHEWMHILGFLHMQSTHDRDEYVRIVEENLISGESKRFLTFLTRRLIIIAVEVVALFIGWSDIVAIG